MSNATPRTQSFTATVAPVATLPVVDRTVYRAAPVTVASSVDTLGFCGASRAWFARKSVFGGVLGSL
jgi:hypothetical protein